MQYIGEKVVKSIDNNIVTFEDDTQVTLNERQLTYLVTEEPKDASQMQMLVVGACVADIFDTLEKHDIRKDDFTNLVNVLVGSYNENFFKATAKAFGVYNENSTPTECVGNIKMSDIANVLWNI